MMHPLHYSTAVTDFCSAQGRAWLQAQVGEALAEGVQAAASGKVPKMPSMPNDLSNGRSGMVAE